MVCFSLYKLKSIQFTGRPNSPFRTAPHLSMLLLHLPTRQALLQGCQRRQLTPLNTHHMTSTGKIWPKYQCAWHHVWLAPAQSVQQHSRMHVHRIMISCWCFVMKDSWSLVLWVSHIFPVVWSLWTVFHARSRKAGIQTWLVCSVQTKKRIFTYCSTNYKSNTQCVKQSPPASWICMVSYLVLSSSCFSEPHCTHVQLSPFYHLSTLDVTHVRKRYQALRVLRATENGMGSGLCIN